MNALHETRKTYIQPESDKTIRRTWLSNVRASEQVFENGDMVFYKRENKERWLGPEKVVFQKIIIINKSHKNIVL